MSATRNWNDSEKLTAFFKKINDLLHVQVGEYLLSNPGVGGIAPPFFALVSRLPNNKSQFEILVDSSEEEALEGKVLTFLDKRDLMEYTPLPPTYMSERQTQNASGDTVPKQVQYVVKAIESVPIVKGEYGPEKAIDNNVSTFAFIPAGPNGEPPIIIADFGGPAELGSMWGNWYSGNLRQFEFSVYTSDDKQTWTPVARLQRVKSDGTVGTITMEGYNLNDDMNKKTTCRYVKVECFGYRNNEKIGNSMALAEIKFLKAPAKMSMEKKDWMYSGGQTTPTPVDPSNPTDPVIVDPTQPQQPTDPVVTPPPVNNGPGVLRKKNIAYPPSKTTKQKSVKYNAQIASQNKAKRHKFLLPLLSKLDKWGQPYANIPELLKILGLNIGIKDYDYAKEITKVNENNNSGGKSKRFDFRDAFMAQYESTIWLNNESKAAGDEESNKHGGTHNDERDIEADCFITQIANDSKFIVQQFEPAHMAPDPDGYGDKFNKITYTDLPKLMGNPHALRFIRVHDLPNKRTIMIVVIKFDNKPADQYGEWTVIYEAHTYDGMGGNRGLKNPWQQWARLELGKDANDTIRMDEQPGTKIVKGKHYKNERITEIVDYELLAAK